MQILVTVLREKKNTEKKLEATFSSYAQGKNFFGKFQNVSKLGQGFKQKKIVNEFKRAKFRPEFLSQTLGRPA